ncbi:MAG TPA: DUF1353 domain-containing protein [Paracoccaceae bacterium]|nr:DUF1353 domain-containing protein [Paracoccaceae bacterium]
MQEILPVIDVATAADAPPENRITQAKFQAARQASSLTSEERRRYRAALRRTAWPPGLIANRWLLAESFAYSFGGKAAAETYIVRAPFEFDGASVPWAVTAFIPRSHSDLLAAAALHDWLYEREFARVPRERADAIFREALQVLGLNWFWALAMWRAVRAGGWVPWYARQPESATGRFLQLPALLRLPLAWAWISLYGLGGFLFADLPRLGTFRREAARIAAEDF